MLKNIAWKEDNVRNICLSVFGEVYVDYYVSIMDHYDCMVKYLLKNRNKFFLNQNMSYLKYHINSLIIRVNWINYVFYTFPSREIGVRIHFVDE